MTFTVTAAGVAAVGLALVVALGPAPVGLLLLAAASLAALITYSWLRAAWFVFGALLVFQSSDSITAQKLAYLAGAGLVAVIAGARVAASDADWLRPFRRTLVASLLLALMLAISLVTALHGTTLTSWLRDAAPVLLLAMSPFVALDCAHDLDASTIFRVTVLGGVCGAVGFTSDWLDRRGVSSLPFGRLLLATTVLAAAGMAVGVTRAALDRRHVRWALFSAAIPTLMLTTGTRTILSFSAAFFGVIGSRAKARIGVGAMLGRIAFPVVAVTAAVLPVLGPLVLSNTEFFQARIRAALTVLRSDPNADLSFAGRQRAYQAVSEAIPQHPVFGLGPGNLHLDIALDTPLTTVLKFGLVGTAVIVVWFVAIVRASQHAARIHGHQPEQTQLRVFLFIIVAMIPFGSPLEDKGMPMAMCLLLASIAVAARTSPTAPAERAADPVDITAARRPNRAVATSRSARAGRTW